MSPKIVVVTGASRGIGAAIARKFVSNSCSVVVNYNKSESDAYKLCEALNMNSSNGALAIPYQCDCSDQNQVQAMFKNVVQKFGKVDILVNNAAIVDDAISIKMSSEKFNKVIQTNINSAFYCSQSAISLGKMLRNKHGRIVNISSIVGIVSTNEYMTLFISLRTVMIGFVSCSYCRQGTEDRRIMRHRKQVCWD